ncbi:FAD-binding protein [Bradyrhizobium sp. 44]|uniref:FAD-binding protein n=1 Tax=Bradyrhizobium sp. 44 TaxID=2782675 RepID=UPI003211DD1A
MIAYGLDGLTSNNADVTVIGAGPAGITLALECARLGRSVLLLESGAKSRSYETQQPTLLREDNRNKQSPRHGGLHC